MAAITKIKQFFTGGNEEVPAAGDRQNNQLFASGNPTYMEVRRRGEGYNIFTSTAFAALVSVPTTVARLEMYNNGSRLAVVSDLHLWRLIGSAVGVGDVIWAMVSTAKAIPALTAQTLFSMSGRASIIPTATSEMVTGVGTTVIANGWQAYGLPAGYLGAATPGVGANTPIDGKLIIPPGTSLCLQVTSSVTTASAFHMGVTFDWVNATVEA